MCCFLATSLLKYAYTCVHNVRYICNVIKRCLTLMASKYAQFPSDVINKICVHMCTQICYLLFYWCIFSKTKHVLMTLQFIRIWVHFIVDLNNGLPASRATRGPSPILGSSWQHNHQNRLFLLHAYLCCEFVYQTFFLEVFIDYFTYYTSMYNFQFIPI